MFIVIDGCIKTLPFCIPGVKKFILTQHFSMSFFKAINLLRKLREEIIKQISTNLPCDQIEMLKYRHGQQIIRFKV